MKNAGKQIPGGTFRISRAENERLCSAVGAEPDPGDRARPILYYIATQVGMGLSVADLLALCEFDVADGPLMVGSEVTFYSDLKVEQDYSVVGEIDSLERKASRAFGAMDLLSFTLNLSSASGTPIVSCTNKWVLPRKGVAAK